MTDQTAFLDPVVSPHAGSTRSLGPRGDPHLHICPFALLSSTPSTSSTSQTHLKDSQAEDTVTTCPFHLYKHGQQTSYAVPIDTERASALHALDSLHRLMRHDDYDRTVESACLLRAIGGGRRILELTTRFYALAFQDRQLKEFFFANDGAAAHGDRLGHWLIQFMGGEGNPWDDSGREGMRQPSHAKAWFSPHRPAARRGRRFKLDDCRVWMRLMFWAARQVGLFPSSDASATELPHDTISADPQAALIPVETQRAFESWFVTFIGFFIRIYEQSAPPYAQRDAAWSLNPVNIQRYETDGRAMLDVIGILHG